MKYAAKSVRRSGENAEIGQDRFAVSRGRKTLGASRALARCPVQVAQPYTDVHTRLFIADRARLYTYKLFLEQAHALLRERRTDSDFWFRRGCTRTMGRMRCADLFLERCRWEWLFGVENREGVFPIHRSYKFNPVIVEKGGTTEAIRTAFMRPQSRRLGTRR